MRRIIINTIAIVGVLVAITAWPAVVSLYVTEHTMKRGIETISRLSSRPQVCYSNTEWDAMPTEQQAELLCAYQDTNFDFYPKTEVCFSGIPIPGRDCRGEPHALRN